MDINFATEDSKMRALDAKYDQQLQLIVARDTEHQRQLADRGGTMTSSLGEDAETAAAAVMRVRDGARAILAAPVVKAIESEHPRLSQEALDAAREFLQKWARLAAFESNANHYLERAGQPLRRRVTGAHADAAGFIERAEACARAEATPAPRVARPALARPTFSDLVAS